MDCLDLDQLNDESERVFNDLNSVNDALYAFGNEVRGFEKMMGCNQREEYADRASQVVSKLIECEQKVKDNLNAAKLAFKELQNSFENESEEKDNDFRSSDELYDNFLKEVHTNLELDSHLKYRQIMEVFHSHNDDALTDDNEEDEELQTLDTTPQQIPIDPFTQKPVSLPVKNKICGHIYDKDGFSNYIKRFAKDVKKLRCPVGGCSNLSKLTPDSVEDDMPMRYLIRRLQQKK